MPAAPEAAENTQAAGLFWFTTSSDEMILHMAALKGWNLRMLNAFAW